MDIKQKVLEEYRREVGMREIDQRGFHAPTVIDKTLDEVEKVIKEEIRTDLRGIPEPQCESLWRILKRLRKTGVVSK